MIDKSVEMFFVGILLQRQKSKQTGWWHVIVNPGTLLMKAFPCVEYKKCIRCGRLSLFQKV